MGSRLDGKVALITGASRGQGAAEARLFAAEGAAAVLIADVLDEPGRHLAGEIGGRARYMHLDVSDAGDWAGAVSRVVEEFGRVDVLVNNAAIHHLRSIEDETPEEFERIIAVNLKGTFLGIRAVIAPMRAAGGGSIVNVSSLAGLRPVPFHAAYGSSKFGVTGLTQIAAMELGHHGIRVNSVHPGPIDTDMLPERAKAPDRMTRYPLGRVGAPEEVAATVLFLASDASSYVTGAAVTVDGGVGLGTLGG